MPTYLAERNISFLARNVRQRVPSFGARIWQYDKKQHQQIVLPRERKKKRLVNAFRVFATRFSRFSGRFFFFFLRVVRTLFRNDIFLRRGRKIWSASVRLCRGVLSSPSFSFSLRFWAYERIDFKIMFFFYLQFFWKQIFGQWKCSDLYILYVRQKIGSPRPKLVLYSWSFFFQILELWSKNKSANIIETFTLQ